jgi:16S rRNA (cytosine1402-N4)-methyltransferase
LLGLDLDPQAIALAQEKLSEFGKRSSLVQASYTTLSKQLIRLEWASVDGIVLDLGSSSMQFDTPERGFSFQKDGPLDMRFNPTALITAADIVNTWDQESIADILYRYGEERRSHQIAKAIVQARPLQSTHQLADVVTGAIKGYRKSHLHPATRSFQALRIAVNGELDAIKQALPQAVEVLSSGGRVAVISFHSLEDRIVKHFFRDHSQDKRDMNHPLAPVVREATLKLVNRKPILPGEEEVRSNPRARSAKLRVAEKI